MLQRWISVAVATASIGALAGCGAVSGGGGATAPVNTNLTGNWLLAGTLPNINSNMLPAPVGVTATFQVTGSNVVGAVTGIFPCSTVETGDYVGAVQGTIAADGSFTLTSAVLPNGSTASIQGRVPETAGGTWSGSYTISTMCGSSSGQVAASSFPLITGTYAGNAVLGSLSSTTTYPITVKTNLQQGGYIGSGTTSSYSEVLLTGTIAITGSPCLSSGTSTGAVSPGGVSGNSVLATFLMNDGSTFIMSGPVTSMDISKMQVSFFTLGAGTCNSNSIGLPAQLVKQ